MRPGSGLTYLGTMPNRSRIWHWLVLLAWLALAGSLRAQGDTTTPTDGGNAQDEGFPVSLDGEELFRIRTPLGPFSAEERAEQSQARILRIANDPFYSPELLTVEERDGTVQVHYRGEQVGAMSAKEAEVYGRPARELIDGILQTVKAAIEDYRESRRPRAWVRGVLIILGSGLALAVLLRVLLRRHVALQERRREAGAVLSKWIFKRRRSISAEKLLEIELRLLRWGRNALIVLLALVFLEVAFLALPITEAWARSILHYLLDPIASLRDAFLLHVGDLFFILVIVVLTRWLLRALRWSALEAKAGTIVLPMVTRDTALPAYKVLRLVVIAVAGMMIYPYIPGSSSAAFKGVGLFAGALFTLGASGAANSMIGGVTLIFTDVFRVGDRIQVGEVSGDVIEVTLFITRLRTPKNEVVTMANGNILSSRIVNYSQEARRRGLILHTSVTIGYDVPWRRVHELLIEAAKATEDVDETPEPFVLQTSLDDFYVSYQLNAYTRKPNGMAQIYSALHQNIQDAFHSGGVEIMSPHYAALRDGGSAAIPADRGAAGEARPFVVRLEDSSRG